MTNSIADLGESDVILVMGSNTTEAHPIIGLALKAARKRGARIIVADPRRIRLVDHAHSWLRLNPGTNTALINGIMNVILAEGLADERFIAERTEGFDDLVPVLEDSPPEMVEKITGVPAEDIRSAARTYAEAERASIVYCMGVTQHTSGTTQVLALANLAMLTGNVGRPGTGVNPLRGQNNVQGACDMGCLPAFFPGYRGIDDDEARSVFEEAWGRPLPSHPGLTLVEMTGAALSGRLLAMFVMGENPAVSDPDQTRVLEALGRLDFLAVQDIFLTETARMADVVLPAASFAEKDGTFTNTERRVQRLRAAIAPLGEARSDCEILTELLERFDVKGRHGSVAEVMDEVASVVPSYGGISHARLETTSIQWPCPDAEHPGTPILHTERFTRGLGRFIASKYEPPPEIPDQDYPMMLTTGRTLTHYHTGSMTRNAAGLSEICPHGYAEVSPEDALRLGLADEDWVEIESRRGAITIRVQATERSPVGVVFLPFHFTEAPANRLTDAEETDPSSGMPALKLSAVRIRHVEAPR